MQHIELQQGLPLMESKIRKFIVEIILGLDFIHSCNIVHRDLKPRNIFLKGKNLEVKIGDFGVRSNLSSKLLIDSNHYEWKEYQQLQHRYALLFLAGGGQE